MLAFVASSTHLVEGGWVGVGVNVGVGGWVGLNVGVGVGGWVGVMVGFEGGCRCRLYFSIH
jgi:hypothetical protein